VEVLEGEDDGRARCKPPDQAQVQLEPLPPPSAAGREVGADGLDERRQRQPLALDVDARSDQRERFGCPGACEHLLDEPRLADADLAGDQNRARAAGGGPGQAVVEVRELLGSADKRGTRVRAGSFTHRAAVRGSAASRTGPPRTANRSIPSISSSLP
jgi:hypothetical protein